MNTRNFIILHHTASFATDGHDQFDAVKRYHIGKGWGDIGYHYFIERSGVVKKGRDEAEAGAHCWQWLMNYRSIGICLAGDFDHQEPSQPQWDALKDLLTDVQLRNGIHNGCVKFHRDFAGYKDCPGQAVSQQKLDAILFSRNMRDRIQVQPQQDLTPSHP